MISIIVPVYNGGRYIAECIESVINQDCADWELILVDDGSTDNTREICCSFCDDNRIRYYFKDNSGVQETRWYGIEKAKYDYILFIDADDVIMNNMASSCVNTIKLNVDIIVYDKQNFDINHPINYINNFKQDTNTIRPERFSIMKSILTGKYLSSVVGILYRKELLIQSKNMFLNNLKIGEDMMFNLELSYNNNLKILHYPYSLYCYRVNEESVMHVINEQKFDKVYECIVYLEKFIETNHLTMKLKKEYSFRMLLLWSTFVFHKDNKYYNDNSLRDKMKKFYIPAFGYLYNYLRFYLLKDFILYRK